MTAPATPRRAARRRCLRATALGLAGAAGFAGVPGLPDLARAQPSAKQTERQGLILHETGAIDGRPLFKLPLVDLDNRPASGALRAGRPMIVNFWARWCAPCRVEIPELIALHRRRTGVDVIGLNIENDPAPVRDFAKAYEIDYPVYVAREGALELMRALGNPTAGLPFTVALDRSGAVVARRLGVLRSEHLDAAVERALR